MQILEKNDTNKKYKFCIDNYISENVLRISKGSSLGSFIILFSTFADYIAQLNKTDKVSIYTAQLQNNNELYKSLVEVKIEHTKTDSFKEYLLKTKSSILTALNNTDSTIIINKNKPSISFTMKGLNEISTVIAGTDINIEISADIKEITVMLSHKVFVQDLELFIYTYLEYLSNIIENPYKPTFNDNLSQNNSYGYIDVLEEKFEVLSAQKRIYIAIKSDENSIAYNISLAWTINGFLDYSKLNDCFKEVCRRHDSLRMQFTIENGEVYQYIDNNLELNLEVFDAIGMSKSELDVFVNSLIKPFCLENGPLVRLYAIRIDDSSNILLLDISHIICDGVSSSILFKEIFKLYCGNSLKDVSLQYQEYINWYNQYYKKVVLKEQEPYWVDKYKENIPVLNLLTDYNRPTNRTFQGEYLFYEIPQDVLSGIDAIASEANCSMFMVLLSIYNILLYKYSGQQEIIVGSPVSGRNIHEISSTIGMFVNTITFKNIIIGDDSFIAFLDKVINECLNAYDNQDYSFEDLITTLEINNKSDRNPLFDTMLLLQESEQTSFFIGNMRFETYELTAPSSKFDLTFEFTNCDKCLNLKVEYSTALFKTETINQMITHYINIARAIIINNNIFIKDIDMLGLNEKKLILDCSTGTFLNYPKDKTISRLFRDVVAINKDNIAVRHEGLEITYGELDIKSDQIAAMLREKGLRRGSAVGVFMQHGIELFIGVLGIIKAGGIYLPINTKFPLTRVNYILENSNVQFLLTDNPCINRKEIFEKINLDYINISDKNLYNRNWVEVKDINEPSDICYIIYTSGSTGNPKGVMISHKSLNNYVQTNCLNFNFTNQDVMLLVASLSFDVSVGEIFSSLLSGAIAIPYGKTGECSIQETVDFICSEKVTFVYIPPVILADFVEELEKRKDSLSLSKLMVGVEPIEDDLFKKCATLNDKMRVVNIYGPTETTIYSTCFIYEPQISFGKRIPIGKPIFNTEVYILDKDMKLVPKGVIGEIYISGEGVSEGYINNKLLTNTKFILNPYHANSKMYKTGDLAKWTDDMNIEFQGRDDFQIKVRGIRVEPGEIENTIKNYDGVTAAVVVQKQNKSQCKSLCVYYIANKIIDVNRLKGFLLQKLPEYMIPTCYFQLENFPLNTNGKIDRHLLPSPDMYINIENNDVPTNDIELALSEIWCQILGINSVGINQNFFEIGGHSLLVIMLSSQIFNRFGITIPIGKIFSLQTIYEMSKYIKDTLNSLD